MANYSRQGFLSIMPMAGNYAFAVYPYQFPTAPGVGAEVLDLSGFLKRLTGQHQGLVWGGDICVEDGYVAGIPSMMWSYLKSHIACALARWTGTTTRCVTLLIGNAQQVPGRRMTKRGAGMPYGDPAHHHSRIVD